MDRRGTSLPQLDPGMFRCLPCRRTVTGTPSGHCPQCGWVPPRAPPVVRAPAPPPPARGPWLAPFRRARWPLWVGLSAVALARACQLLHGPGGSP